MPSVRRSWPVLALLVLAPACAEYSSGYLETTGDPLALLGQLLVFSPLYGGAALLVREVAVRLGGGWPVRVLLALAFGLAMPGLVDLSLFTTVRDDVTGWDQIFAPTFVSALGTSLGAATTWSMGHVVLSVTAPLATVEALTGRPDVVRERWLGRRGLGVTAVVFAGSVVVVNAYQRQSYGIEASVAQLAGVAAVVVALVLAAVVVARRRPARQRGVARVGVVRGTRLVLGGVVVTFVGDAAATSWAFLATCWVVVAAAAVLLVRAGLGRGWSPRHSGLLAVGALLSRAATAFANPPPDGVPLEAKLTQNAVFAVVVLLLLVAVVLRRAPDRRPSYAQRRRAGPAVH